MTMRELRKSRFLFFYLKSVVIAFLLLLLTIISPIYLQGQADDIKFEHISIGEGLSQSTVFCIIKDSKDFMWFGTQHGLNRYDGHNSKKYTHNPKIPKSLSHDFVISIFEDSGKILWIGTQGGGLNKFDRKSEEFRAYKNIPRDTSSISSNNVTTILEDQEGTLWIGTDKGLNKFDREGKIFTRYLEQSHIRGQIGDNRVNTICRDKSGTLWVGADEGLYKYEREKDDFIEIKCKNELNDPVPRKTRVIYENPKGGRWIGTEAGLYKFNLENEGFIYDHKSSEKFIGFRNKQITSIYRDSSGRLWVGTLGQGLYVLDTSIERPTQYTNIPGNPDSLSHNEVIYIYGDENSGLVWIGTNGGGINIFDPLRKKFDLYDNIPGSNDIMAICTSNDGGIWVGTFGEGLNKFDPNAEKFTQYKIPYPLSKNPNRNRISALCEDKEGKVWVGTNWAGLYKFDPVKKSFAQYKDNHISEEENIPVIIEDHLGDLWVGTLNSGLIQINANRKKSKPHRNIPGDDKSLSDNAIYSILEDRDGVLWIGTGSGGLNKFDRENETFKRYQPSGKVRDSISHNFIMTIFQDKSGTFWIGTNGGGLNKFDKKTETFTVFTTDNGLPNNVIYAILEDIEGNYWLSTNKGLSRFDPDKERFRNFTIRDGLQGYEFNGRIACKIKKKEKELLFFGGINGLNSFDTEKIKEKDKSFKPTIVITSIKKLNENFKLEEVNSEISELELSYRDDFISFEFASLSFSEPESNRYAYKLEPVNKEWIDLGNKHDVDLVNLEPGKYTFIVKGSNNDGVWNEDGTSIKIIINPPFWATWWFLTLLALCIFGTILFFVRMRIKNIEKKKEELSEAYILLEKEVAALKEGLSFDTLKNPEHFSEIITVNKKMYAIFHNIEAIEKSDLPVLITGETGTGKGLIARAIHKASGRKGNFVARKVGILDDIEFKKELSDLLEQAKNGTLFLDEIGDISRPSQVTLLGLIELRDHSTIGKETRQSINVRIVTATSRDIKSLIESGEFRRDLYYRLKIHEIDIPPLRERKEDIPLLVEHFREISAKMLNKEVPDVPKGLFPLLEIYKFPGNIRELGGMVFDAVNRHQSGPLSLDTFLQIIREKARKKKTKLLFGNLFRRLS